MFVTHGEVRPTNLAAVLASNAKGKKSAYPMKWGYRMEFTTLFNARSETASSKPTFREDWQRHRCIVPASYYFEWKHIKDVSGNTHTGDKYAIQPAGHTVAWLCGLYRIDNGLPYFVILTRDASEDVMKIHDRMPLMLPESKVDEWIHPDTNPETLLKYALTEMVVEKAE